MLCYVPDVMLKAYHQYDIPTGYLKISGQALH